ncbi:hypothetical protein HMI55_003089 [Coelomomyces lativittatus]|nr:hypothetical protein HMI55_003089 [Coelomomyces lativittatus]
MFPSFSSLDPSVSSFFPSERGISSSWHSSSYLDLPPSDFFPFHGSFLPIPPEAACAIVTSSTPLLSPSSMDFNASSTRFAVPTLITTSSSLSPSPSPSLPTLSTGPPAPPPPPFSLSSSFFSSSSDSNTLSLPRPTPPLSDQSPHVLLPTHRRFSSTSSSIQPIPYVTLQRTWSCRSTHPLFSSTEIMDDVHPNAASHGNLWKPRSFLATPPLLTTGLSSIPPRLRRFSLPILPPSSMTPPILRVDPFPSSATFLLRHPRVSSSTVSSSSSSSSSMPPALLSSSPPSSSSLSWSFPSPYRRATYLVCLAMSLTGSFYAFDLPAQLNRALASHFHVPQELWPVPFARLYVVYAFPNMVMPLLSGYAVERWGPRPVLMGLTLLVVVGQSLVTYGLHQRGYLWMLLGRGVLGLGGESLSVAQTSLTYVWFHDSELGFALGFHLGMARLGSVLNDVCTAVIEQTFGIMRAAWVAWVACMVSAGFGGMACYLDTVREKRGLASWGKKDVNVSRGGVEERVPLLKPLESFSLEKGLDIHPSWKSGSEMNVTSRSNPPPLTTTSSTRFFALVYQGLNRKFWALALAMVSVYAAPNTFSSVGSDFLQGKYQFTASQAGFLCTKQKEKRKKKN